MTIHFFIRFFTRPGESLSVTGNTDELGNNDIDKALPLTWLNHDLWTGTVTINNPQADAIRIVTPGLMGIANCEDSRKVQVLNTTAITPPSAAGWSETWTAVACDKKIDVQVTYTAIGNGMNISAGKWKVY